MAMGLTYCMTSDSSSQSKWVSEKMIANARDRGIPVVIHRPGNFPCQSQDSVVKEMSVDTQLPEHRMKVTFIHFSYVELFN